MAHRDIGSASEFIYEINVPSLPHCSKMVTLIKEETDISFGIECQPVKFTWNSNRETYDIARCITRIDKDCEAKLSGLLRLGDTIKFINGITVRLLSDEHFYDTFNNSSILRLKICSEESIRYLVVNAHLAYLKAKSEIIQREYDTLFKNTTNEHVTKEAARFNKELVTKTHQGKPVTYEVYKF